MNTRTKLHDISLNMYCCMYTNCGTEYATKFNLKRHVESVHLKIRKFKCQACGCFLISKQSLKEHYHIHLGSMPFKCVTCDKTFRQASQLSLHKRIHVTKGTYGEYEKNYIELDACSFLPIQIEYKLDLDNLTLPLISSDRAKPATLPAPRPTFNN
jgi:uncharacterized Zn-finger protein